MDCSNKTKRQPNNMQPYKMEKVKMNFKKGKFHFFRQNTGEFSSFWAIQ